MTEGNGSDENVGSEAAGESPSSAEPAKDEPVKAEPPKAEEAKDETVKAEPAKAEPPKVEEAKASPPEEDEGEQVEPEPLSAPKNDGKGKPHHPPPPPSLRKRSASDKDGPGTRFELAGTPKLARDIMSRQIFTIEPEATLEHLEEHMKQYRFGHLPVVDGDKLVGLISHGDLLHASSSFLSERAKERDEIIHKVPVTRIMQRDLITVSPSDTLADVALLMWEARVGCVLVIEGEDKLVGIITEGDFLRVAHHFLAHGDQAAKQAPKAG
ncbi:MAG TPA: CBS domain-containing protein [Polyangiaceae bacterium]|jgi:CBS domain-containing membrane protein|nr:CBS domain-containing protein [Polyangiaceae bacterium]